MASRDCNHPADAFIYVCSQFFKTIAKKFSIQASLKMYETYKAYFDMSVGNQDKPWAPHFACKNCKRTLEGWYIGERRSIEFAIPSIWREATDHSSNCYFYCYKGLLGFSFSWMSQTNSDRTILLHRNMEATISSGGLTVTIKFMEGGKRVIILIYYANESEKNLVHVDMEVISDLNMTRYKEDHEMDPTSPLVVMKPSPEFHNEDD